MDSETRGSGFGVRGSGFGDGAPSLSGLAAEAEAALANSSCRSEIVRQLLATGHEHDRVSVAHILAQFPDSDCIDVLLSMAGGSPSEVQAAAAAALNRLVAAGCEDEAVVPVLKRLLSEGGRAVAGAIIAQLPSSDAETDT
ncbi:HEAT repeat domain-containing protein [Hoyosella rhizosphaerae]|uniref:HEAT repeat domain-containing protein n=1 Tax=Hoyosella rhizosphaerae TaxID=1755582 RepID=A0A916XHS2_9ACTN|nr:HEAT repeat domain-containing protein [Hoyosella rhizosphaerae]MBN4928339.1 HEAT repeat domain-containing protein [Hoyosella rhizosphaerae]GGC74182.1 hypothetical protein GCM10011410_29290 [Hoyosella rhizosphaerae]